MGYLSAIKEQESCDETEPSECERLKLPLALEMMYNLSSIIEDADQVEDLATATDLLLRSPERLDPNEQVVGGYIVGKLTESLEKLSEKGERFRDLSPAATAIVDTVSTLVEDGVQGDVMPKDESHLLPPRKRKAYKEKLEKEQLEKQEEQWKLKKESVSALMAQVGHIAKALMTSSAFPESPNTIGTKAVQLVVHKESKSELGEEPVSLPAGKVDLPTDDALLPFTPSSSDVSWKITGFNDNLYVWDKSAGDIKSSIVDVTLEDAKGDEIPVNGLSEDITIVLKNRPEMFQVGHLVNYKHYGNDTMAFRDFQALGNATYGVTLTVRTAAFIGEVRMYGKLGGDPNDTDHDFRRLISWGDFDITEYEDVTGYEGKLATFTAYIVLPVGKVNNGNGQYTLGLLIDECLSQKCKYSVDIVRVGCRYWDSEDNVWKGDGCKVSPKTTREETVCLCDHLTAFGADIVRVPTRDPFYSRSAVVQDSSMVCLEE
ncbi:polycystin-1-like protein 2 [Branchiostoma lanceolatum]|uniref:polycystin-1-like protein 2 n=1 Tax=Branchiostoma lanceolatum TaxID=7740 RepID=UPI0034528DF1